VTADRGYGETSIEDVLTALGVATVVLPTRANRTRHVEPSSNAPSFNDW
jgi:hypothetical protein